MSNSKTDRQKNRSKDSGLDKADNALLIECVYLGSVALTNRKPSEALVCFEKGLALLYKGGITSGADAAACYVGLSKTYTALGRTDDALKALQGLLKVDDGLDNRRLYISFLTRIAEDWQRAGEPLKAEAAFGDALEKASGLLPANDPLLSKLNQHCALSFKRTLKGQNLAMGVPQVVLTAIPIPEATEPVRRELSEAEKLALEAAPLGSARPSQTLAQLANLGNLLQSNTLLYCGAGILALTIGFCALTVAQYCGENNRTARTLSPVPGDYRSCDDVTCMTIESAGKCVINSPEFAYDGPFISPDGKNADLTRFVRGYLSRPERWYVQGADMVTTPERTVLYRTGSVELAVRDQMNVIAAAAQKYYQQNHFYPKNVAALARAGYSLAYLNPKTLKKEEPDIVFLKGFASDPALTSRLTGDAQYPHYKPASIFCICLDRQKFFIHGCDREGRPLTASDPTRFFVVECNRGKEVKRVNAPVFAPVQKPAVFLSTDAGEEGTVSIFRRFCLGILWLGFILATLACAAAFRLKKGGATVVACGGLAVMALVLLLGWYGFALLH